MAKKYLDSEGLKVLVDGIKDGSLVSGKAIADNNGSAITTTYATKTEVQNAISALDSALSASTAENGAQQIITGIEMQDGKLSAIDVATLDSNDILLEEDISVLGVNIGALSNGASLTAGTSFTNILKALLIKVQERTIVKPTVTINGDTNKTFEVGYNYSVELGHTYTDGAFTGTAENGFNPTSAPAGCAEGTTKYYLDNVEQTSNQISFVVANNSRSMKCITAYGASSNANVRNNGSDSSSGITAGTATSGNITITGRYKAYLGYANVTSVSQVDSDLIKTLNVATPNCNADGSVTLVETGVKKTSNGQSIVVAVPNISKLSAVANGIGADILSSFSVTGTTSYTNGSTTTEYNVYIYPITNGSPVEYQGVKVSKK